MCISFMFINASLYTDAQTAYTQGNTIRAKELFIKSCISGNKLGCKQLELLDQNYKYTVRPKEKFLKHYCDKGDGKSCFKFALMNYNKTNDKLKKELFTKACDYGYKKSCGYAAYYYNPINEEQLAKKYLSKGCEYGDYQSCYILGEIYFKNKITKDKAIDLFKSSCKGKNSKACLKLGYIYFNGYHVQKNVDKSIQILENDCNKNLGLFSCQFLGIVNYYGETGKINKNLAAEYYKKACQPPFKVGCYKLGQMYESGDGIKLDRIKALDFYQQACDGGNEDGCVAYDFLSNQL